MIVQDMTADGSGQCRLSVATENHVHLFLGKGIPLWRSWSETGEMRLSSTFCMRTSLTSGKRSMIKLPACHSLQHLARLQLTISYATAFAEIASCGARAET